MTDHIPNDLSHLSDEEFHSLCPQGEHAPGPAMTDFCALCEELVDELHYQSSDHRSDELIARARAALAEQPVGPTEEELLEMFNENDWNHISPETFQDIARIVLAQWGQP